MLGAHDLRVEEPSQQKLSVVRQFTNSYNPEEHLNDVLILEVGGLARCARPMPEQAWPAGESHTWACPLLSERAPHLHGSDSADSGSAISFPLTICQSPPLGPSRTQIRPRRAEVGSRGLAEDGACSWHPIRAL